MLHRIHTQVRRGRVVRHGVEMVEAPNVYEAREVVAEALRNDPAVDEYTLTIYSHPLHTTEA